MLTDSKPSGAPGRGIRTTVGDREISLTATEYRLLEALRGQPGRAFSRAELVALVMPDTVVLERTIDAHIKALRGKLGPGRSQIKTVRSVGYQFVATGEPAAEPRPAS